MDPRGIFLGFALGLLASYLNDLRRDRRDRRRLASAVVYEVRRGLANLTDLQSALSQEGVIYSSGFQESIFTGHQRDHADFGATAYNSLAAFFAQLRNVNYLRDEFQKWEERQTSDPSASLMMANVGTTLQRCVETGVHHGHEALVALRNHTQPAAFVAELPERFYTEEERKLMGKPPPQDSAEKAEASTNYDFWRAVNQYAREDIRWLKEQQWRVSQHCLLIYAGLVGYAWTKTLSENWRCLLSGLVVITGLAACGFIWMFQSSVGTARERGESAVKKFPPAVQELLPSGKDNLSNELTVWALVYAIIVGAVVSVGLVLRT